MGSFDARRFQDRNRTSGAEDCHNGEKKENHRSYLGTLKRSQ
jgi:hypothetical protein